MSIYDRVQMIKRASCCEGMEETENHVGCSDVELEKDKGNVVDSIVSGGPKATGSFKTRSTKVIGVKKDDSPMVLRVIHESGGGPIGESSDENGPATVQVGKDSVESLGRALNILKQLKF